MQTYAIGGWSPGRNGIGLRRLRFTHGDRLIVQIIRKSSSIQADPEGVSSANKSICYSKPTGVYLPGHLQDHLDTRADMIRYRTSSLRYVLTGLFALAIFPVAGVSPGAESPAPVSEFDFVRMYYTSGNPYTGGPAYRNAHTWRIDWPDAEHHFLQGLRRLTRIDASAEGRMLSLLDDRVYDFPWLYAIEVGHWHLSDEETLRLREYLLRGGFLMVDDFHGTREWAGFMSSMQRVFPDRPVIEINPTDEVMHVFYDLENNIQIHGMQYFYSGQTFEEDGITPHWRGIFDDEGRLMVAINFNMDIGDAWEHADTPYYPQPMTALAYRYGVNYVIYAMTH